MNLRLLLVEPEPEEAFFLKDVLADIEAGCHFRTWVHIDTVHVETWADAEAILSTEKMDVVLLNPGTAGQPAVRGVSTVQAGGSQNTGGRTVAYGRRSCRCPDAWWKALRIS